MKWLKLSVEKFEPIPDISFAVKKPLFAASVFLKYSRALGSSFIEAVAVVEARISIKGELKYQVEAVSSAPGEPQTFSFLTVFERDVTGGSSRKIEADGSSLTITKSRKDGSSVTSVDIVNESPSPILAHLFILPAFQQSRDDETDIYGAYIAVGDSVKAVRFERIGINDHIESYEGRFISVPQALSEKDWGALPWDTKKRFEFDWAVEKKTISSARISVPLFGQLEIKN